MFFLERAWAEIDLDAAKFNLTQIQNCLRPDTRLMAVVKADAYGCGSGYIKSMISWGVRDFAVSNLEEARQVRQLGAEGVVLILGLTPPRHAKALAELGLTQTVFFPFLCPGAQRSGGSGWGHGALPSESGYRHGQDRFFRF